MPSRELTSTFSQANIPEKKNITREGGLNGGIAKASGSVALEYSDVGESPWKKLAESEKMLFLAKSAFDRGDYSRADVRMENALLVYSIEFGRVWG